MIRKGRIIVSLGMLLVMVLTFGGLLAPVLPHWQFLPALLVGNFLALALILAVTFLFGRVYCSVLCPLGISQDLVIWLSGRCRKKRRSFAFARERRGLRYAILFLAGLSILFGYPLFLGLVAPYSIFGRILNDLFALPVSYGWNAIVGLSERYDWLPLLMKAEVQQPSAWAAVLAGIYLIVLVALSWRHGRAYCHTICPVGTLLGTVSRFSVFRPVIDADRCIHCGACERTCPSACIDAKTGGIDSSRCVDCFDCLTICPKDALHFSRSHHAQQKVRMTETEPADTPPSGPVMTRRELLGTTALAIGTVAAGLVRSRSAMSAAVGAWGLEGEASILPPGAQSADSFYTHCTSCHLCVSRCPSGVLLSSGPENGALHLLQPHMDFSQGYCVYNCNLCSVVCPTGAIRPLSLAEKQQTKIGLARYDKQQCLITRDGIVCGNCARHCLTQAITMVEDRDGRSYPVIDDAACIGCGSCEYHCPAEPSAIHIIGIAELLR